MALGGVVELGETEACFGESVKMGGFDFGAVAAEIGEAEVICHDDDDVWADFSLRPYGEEEGDDEKAHGANLLEFPWRRHKKISPPRKVG
jgi:hypothetical protein